MRWHVRVYEFPFSSNGKVYPKAGVDLEQVRPSKLIGFNSLQTGKCIQRIFRFYT